MLDIYWASSISSIVDVFSISLKLYTVQQEYFDGRMTLTGE